MPITPPTRRQVLRASVAWALADALATRTATATPAGQTWRVGPGEALTRIADALRRAADGDTIEVASGTYRGDVAVIRQRRLRIVGIGESPVFDADGRNAEGKAIWVVHDGDIRIENIAFRGARVPDGNGAGIRFQAGRLQLHRCRFVDNQMGLLTGNVAESELVITDSEFADAPHNPGSLPHLLYVGRIGRFSIRGSVLRRGNEGHLLKSRACTSTITGNWFDDGRDGQASYEIDLPNGGIAEVTGNTLVQSPLTQNPVMLSYGAEGKPWDENRLTVEGNTFVNRRNEGGTFVRVWAERLPAGTPVLSRGNRLLGPGDLELGPNSRSEGDQRGPVPAD